MRKKTAQPVLPKRLKENRKKIDLIDQKLLGLLSQRLRIVQKIGNVKKKMGIKIYDPGREKEVLEKLRLRLESSNKGLLEKKDLEKIFATIIKVCRRSQK
jgi:chorismate mutase/prephenate dehydratase